MSCLDNYITPNTSIPSRSGLYASLLPGVDSDMLEGIAKEIDSSPEYNTWDELIYPRAVQNLIADVSNRMQSKFFVDLKLVSRESSDFLSDYNSGTLSGIKFNFSLPKYGKSHIISLEVFSQSAYSNVEFKFYDTDENGELLFTKNSDIVAGRNTINVDMYFEVDQIYIAYDSSAYSFKKTQNKYFSTNWLWDSVVCEVDCGNGERSTITQVNGGGINAKFVVTCSIEKFICDNINIFKSSLLWKIGQEICIERRFGERLNRFTTMTVERFEELGGFYDANFEKELSNATKSQNVYEDPVCFQCKTPVYVQTNLP